MRIWALASVMIGVQLMNPSEGLAQRFGVIPGTYEACRLDTADLEQEVDAIDVDPNASAEVKERWKRRLAVALDRCAQIDDAPAAAIVETVGLYEDVGQDERALFIVTGALKKFGEEPALNLAAGEILMRLERADEAVPFFEAVLAKLPMDPGANRALGKYYYEGGKTKKALPYLQRYAEGAPDSFEANAALGDACLSVEDLQCAARYLSRASAIRPTDTLLAVKVGDLGLSVGDYQTSAAAYRRATNQEPERGSAWLGLGISQERLGYVEAAYGSLVQAAAKGAEGIDHKLAMSRIGRKRQRLESRLVWTTPELKKVPAKKRQDLVLEHLAALNTVKRRNDAWGFYRGLKEGERSDWRALVLAGDSRFGADVERAAQLYKTALERAPKQPAVQQRFLRAVRKRGAYEGFEASASDNPIVQRENALTAFSKAADAASDGKTGQAKQALQSALSLDKEEPRYQRAARLLGMQEAGEDQWVKAWEAYQSGDTAGAYVMSNEIFGKGGSPRIAALAFAAASENRPPEGIAPSLKKVDREGVFAPWHDYVWAREAHESIKARARDAQDSLSRVGDDAGAGEWRRDAGNVLAVRSGQDPERAKESSELRTAFDVVLRTNKSQYALAGKKARKLRSDATGQDVRSHVAIRKAASLYRRGNYAAAAKSSSGVRFSTPDPKLRLSLMIIGQRGTTGDISDLQPKLSTIRDKDISNFLLGVRYEKKGESEKAARAYGSVGNTAPNADDAGELSDLKSKLTQPLKGRKGDES